INRINMLATGIRTDVGIKVYGQRLDSIQQVSERVRDALTGVPGVHDLFVEPVTGGRYLEIQIDRDKLSRYGLSVEDVNMTVESALGGMPITNTVEGRQRFNIQLRLAEDFRNSIEKLGRVPLNSADAGIVPLSSVA